LNGEWWVVGGSGTVLRSSDGETWNQVTVNNLGTTHCYDIEYGGGIYAIATTDFIYYSSDGVTWSRNRQNTNNRFRALVYFKGVWAALGGNEGSSSTSPRFFRSTDNWA